MAAGAGNAPRTSQIVLRPTAADWAPERDPPHGESVSLRSWLDVLGEIGRAVNHARPLREILDLIANSVCRLMGYDFCSVLMSRDDPPQLVIEGAAGLSADYVDRVNAEHPIHLLPGEPLGEGPSTRAFRSLRPVIVPDMLADPTLEPWTEFVREAGFRSMLSVPLVASGKALGVVNAYTTRQHAYERAERMRVEQLAGMAAIAIESATLRHREQRTIADLQCLNAALGVQRDLLERTEALHRELMTISLSDADLPRIVEAVSQVVGEQVFLHGSGLPTVPADAPAVAELEPRCHDDVPIVHNGEVVGHLLTDIPASDPAEATLRRRALESGALVISLQLQREAAAQEERLRFSSELLRQLLDSDSSIDEWAIHRQATQLGHDLTRAHRVMVVRVDAPDAARSHMDPLSAQRRVAGIARLVTEHMTPRPLAGPISDFVALLIPMDEAADPAAVRKVAATLQRKVREALSPLTVSVVIGPTCDDLHDYADVCHLAITALDLRKDRAAPERVVSLTDLGIHHFLLQARRPRELADFASELLDPLREANRSGLMETLRAYLENRMSTAETARQLFVHVNTVTYRIRRIEEILGVDLRNPDVLLNLKFALVIDEVLSS